MTAQHTLAALAARDAAFQDVVSAIESVMASGALALAATRDENSPYWLEHEVDLSDRAPFRGRVRLAWRDQGSNSGLPIRAPFDSEIGKRYARVHVPPDTSPEVMAELLRIAVMETAQLVRTCEAKTRAAVSRLESETQALRAICKP